MHWRIVITGTPAQTSFHKTSYNVSFWLQCNEVNKKHTKTESISRSQIHQMMFEVPDIENVKIILFVVSVMLPISNIKTVSGILLPMKGTFTNLNFAFDTNPSAHNFSTHTQCSINRTLMWMHGHWRVKWDILTGCAKTLTPNQKILRTSFGVYHVPFMPEK